MSLLITGASGYVGGALMDRLGEIFEVKGWQGSQKSDSLTKVDIRNRELVQKTLIEDKPEVIIHAAALIDGCDENPELATQINVEGTRHIAEIASELRIPTVFISTAAVFDSKRGTFRETDMPEPKSVYGKTKLEAEQIIRDINAPSLILRPSFIVGTSPTGSHRSYPRTLSQLLKGNHVEIDQEWQFTPSALGHIAKVIDWWLQHPVKETLHVAVGKTSSKYKLMKDLAFQLGIDPQLVTPKSLEAEQASFSKEGLSSKERTVVPLNLLESTHLSEIGAPTLSYEKMIALLAQEVQSLPK